MLLVFDFINSMKGKNNMTSTTKKSVYQIITDTIIDKLEQGVVPWVKPWLGGNPKNLISGKEYRGINLFLLAFNSFSSPYYLTFNQAKKLGGKVKKGSKSSIVTFWKELEVKDKDFPGELVKIPMLRYYRVFNLDQVELPALSKLPKRIQGYLGEDAPTNNVKPIPAAKEMIKSWLGCPEISHEGNSACYRPELDIIAMPYVNAFSKSEEYYATLFHELVHATGHKDRLNRDGFTGRVQFGSSSYSKEELIAEMGAAFLCAQTGISEQVIDNSAAYISSWLGKLRNDPKMVVQAAGKAQKAVDHIRNITYAKS